MIKWDLVVDKPIFLVMHGHSVKELERRWSEFENFDIMWAGMNNCTYLSRWMKKPLDILVYYCTHCHCKTYKHRHWLKASEARGNSFYEFLLQCMENDVKDLVLFGADGYSDIKESGVYGSTDQGQSIHKRECEHFNANFPKDIKTKITNVSLNSHYDHMKKVSYDEFLADDYYKQWKAQP